MNKKRLALVAPIVCALAVAGCGNGNNNNNAAKATNSGTAETAAPAATKAPKKDVTIKVFQFKVEIVEQLIALFIHNIPEGLSTGFSYASEQASLGPMVAIAIGAQNMPEGLILAVFLINSKVSRRRTLKFVTVTGLMEMVSAAVGYFLANSIRNVVGYGLAFAAGAMLFIVYKELIPESHGHGYERPSTYSFIAGLLALVYITYWFG